LLKLYSFCLSRLLAERLPEVHGLLEGLDAVLGYKWFGTLFTTVLPVEVAARIWDMVFRDGLPALLRCALGLCSLLGPTLREARHDGEDAIEVMGRLQRQLQTDVTPLLPGGAGGAHGNTARLVGERLQGEAQNHAFELDELEALLEVWRLEDPQSAKDLGDSFSFNGPESIVSI